MIESLSQELDFSLRTKIKNGSNFFINFGECVILTKEISEQDFKFILLFFKSYMQRSWKQRDKDFVKYIYTTGLFDLPSEELKSLENFAILNCHSDNKLYCEFSRAILKLKNDYQLHVVELAHQESVIDGEYISYGIKTYNTKLRKFGKKCYGYRKYNSQQLFGKKTSIRNDIFAAYFENLLIK